MKEAIDRAIEAVPGGIALVDGVVSASWFWVILGGQSKISVEGDVLVDPSRRTPEALARYEAKKKEEAKRRARRNDSEDP